MELASNAQKKILDWNWNAVVVLQIALKHITVNCFGTILANNLYEYATNFNLMIELRARKQATNPYRMRVESTECLYPLQIITIIINTSSSEDKGH